MQLMDAVDENRKQVLEVDPLGGPTISYGNDPTTIGVAREDAPEWRFGQNAPTKPADQGKGSIACNLWMLLMKTANKYLK